MEGYSDSQSSDDWCDLGASVPIVNNETMTGNESEQSPKKNIKKRQRTKPKKNIENSSTGGLPKYTDKAVKSEVDLFKHHISIFERRLLHFINGAYQRATQTEKEIVVDNLLSLSQKIFKIPVSSTMINSSNISMFPNSAPPINPIMANSLSSVPFSNSNPLLSSGFMGHVNTMNNSTNPFYVPINPWPQMSQNVNLSSNMIFSGLPKVENNAVKKNIVQQLEKPKIAYKLTTPLMPRELSEAIKLTHTMNSAVIQPYILGNYRCLLCRKSISGDHNVIEHINGKNHNARLENSNANETILTYNNIWNKIGLNYQFHKYFMYPDCNDHIFCEVCNIRVFYENKNDLLRHIHLAKHINNNEIMLKIKIMKDQQILSDIPSGRGARMRTNSSTSVESSGSPFTYNSSAFIEKKNRRNNNNLPENMEELVNTINLKKKQSTDSETIKLMKECYSNPLKLQNQTSDNTSRDVSQSSSSSSISTELSEKFIKDRLQLLWNTVSNNKDLDETNCKLKLLFSENEIDQMSKEITQFTLNEIDKKTKETSVKGNTENPTYVLPTSNTNIRTDVEDKVKMDGAAVLSKSVINLDVWRNVDDKDMINQTYIRAKENNRMQCNLCDTMIARNTSVLKEHIKGRHHQLKLYHKQTLRYYCEACKFFSESFDNFNCHIQEAVHLNNCKEDMPLTEHQCEQCKTVIYSSNATLKNHRHFDLKPVLPAPKRKKKENIPEHARMILCNAENVSALAERLANVAIEVMKDNSKDLEVCRLLEESLAKDFPGCKAYPFGSRVSGLGSPSSDLDVYLDTGNMYNGDKDQDYGSQAHCVTTTYNALKGNRSWGKLEAVTTARTPIVKVLNITHRIDCDISFRHGLSVENTKLLRLMLQMQPLARNLICLLKLWTSAAKLTRWSSYALSFMAIFFLQVRGYLPPVWELMQNHNKTIIGSWECQLTNPRNLTVTPLTVNLSNLLKDFFSFYANEFDFKRKVVCPLMGYSINKELFSRPAQLPEQMNQYKIHFNKIPEELRNDPKSWISRYVVDHPSKDMFRYESPLCVQDPFDLSHNLTKALSDKEIEKFKRYCAVCYKVCGVIPGSRKK